MALLLSRKFCFWSERYLHSCGTRKKTLGLWEWGTNSKHPDEWESIHSVITGHKDREEATPFIVFGKLSKWESSVRKQMFNVCELSQESFLLPNLRLCSLTCERYSTRQWCCSTHRDEGKFFFFPLACTGSFLLCGLLSIWDNRGLLPSCGKHGFLLWWFLLLWSTVPRHTGLSSFTMQPQYLWLINLYIYFIFSINLYIFFIFSIQYLWNNY